MVKGIIMTILQEAKFSKEFIQYIEQHFPSDYQRMESSPFIENYLENPLLHLDAEERMIETIAQLIHLKNTYEEKHIPLSHLYKSIYDLSYRIDRKSTRLNSSHVAISYAVFCLKKKNTQK